MSCSVTYLPRPIVAAPAANLNRSTVPKRDEPTNADYRARKFVVSSQFAAKPPLLVAAEMGVMLLSSCAAIVLLLVH